MTKRKDKLKKNSVRLKWQFSWFLSIKQTLQSTRGGNWRQSNLTGLLHHVKSLFGLNVFLFVWLQVCHPVISIFTSFLPSFGDFLCENTCLLPVLLMLFTWTVVNHQRRLEMHARICTGSPKNKILGFPPTVSGLCLYSKPTSAAEMIIFTRELCGSHGALKINSWEQNLSEKISLKPVQTEKGNGNRCVLGDVW